MKGRLTSDRELWAAGNELQEIFSLRQIKLAHHLQEVSHALAIHIISVVCLDRVTQCYKTIRQLSSNV